MDLLYHRAKYGADRGSHAGCRRKSVMFLFCLSVWFLFVTLWIKFVITETLWSSVIFQTIMVQLHRGRFVVVHCTYCIWVAQIKIPHRTKCNFSTTVRFFIPKFLDLYGRDPATILKFKKKYFYFLQSYGCINILCHIFNFAQNNQLQLLIFIVKNRLRFDVLRWLCACYKLFLRLQVPKSDK